MKLFVSNNQRSTGIDLRQIPTIEKLQWYFELNNCVGLTQFRKVWKGLVHIFRVKLQMFYFFICMFFLFNIFI